MPGYSYSLPAQECITGSILRDDPESPCYKCYAMKGRYNFPNVKNKLYARFDAIDHPKWVDAMIFLISDTVTVRVPYFRWHDSGDVQNIVHLRKIVEIAKRLPEINFWLPTQEHDILFKFLEEDYIPDNLVIRISNKQIANNRYEKDFNDIHSSSVLKLADDQYIKELKNSDRKSYLCPSTSQGGQCKDCRACWKPNIEHIVYRMH